MTRAGGRLAGPLERGSVAPQSLGATLPQVGLLGQVRYGRMKL